MADLSFFYGTMESGKTTKLLQDNYNYCRHGHKVVIIKPLVDTKGGKTVVNRTNNSIDVDILLAKEESLLDLEYLRQIVNAKVILVDEVQFFTQEQVKELWEIAHILDIQVICYGLKNDFRGIPFEGSIALFGFADHKTELTVRCECGEIANFNARLVDDEFTYDGDIVAIDGEHNVSYVPLCSDCYLKYVMDGNHVKELLQRKRLAKDEH
ncbi:MAG: thymidine kinase [Firmicutes bacterium]|nr:thymidine kinase [Bacillota bacterium]